MKNQFILVVFIVSVIATVFVSCDMGIGGGLGTIPSGAPWFE